jgi:predicted AAA+ superfamily ATPase
MLFERNLEKQLNEWTNSSIRKPLIIRGARQVGKTTLIKKYAKSFKYQILLNLEKKDDKAFFIHFNDAKTIIEALFLSNKISSAEKGKTLLFIDEIQESPEAIQMLRYFYEEFPELHVIAAGSLLEFAIKKVRSFPVGRVEYLYMHPMNFVEFLRAIKHQTAIEQFNHIPVNPFAHQTLINLFNKYAIIGGMPEAIKVYIENDSLIDLPVIYESIWQTFLEDTEKYASGNTARNVLKHIMFTAHLYIDQRVKFQHFGQSDYKSREVGEAFRNLEDARIVRLIYPGTDTETPIRPDLKKSPRLQFLDTGIINHLLGIQADMISMNDLGASYRGAIVPHLIMQEIISLSATTNKKPNFWVREKKQSSSEVDLVFPYGNKLIPIEIKAGSTGTLRSLHQFILQCNHPYAVRMYAGEFRIEKAISPQGKPYLLMNLPYYLGTKLPEYIEYFVEGYSL